MRNKHKKKKIRGELPEHAITRKKKKKKNIIIIKYKQAKQEKDKE